MVRVAGAELGPEIRPPLSGCDRGGRERERRIFFSFSFSVMISFSFSFSFSSSSETEAEAGVEKSGVMHHVVGDAVKVAEKRG